MRGPGMKLTHITYSLLVWTIIALAIVLILCVLGKNLARKILLLSLGFFGVAWHEVLQVPWEGEVSLPVGQAGGCK